jgi:hypothetical protein
MCDKAAMIRVKTSGMLSLWESQLILQRTVKALIRNLLISWKNLLVFQACPVQMQWCQWMVLLKKPKLRS